MTGHLESELTNNS